MTRITKDPEERKAEIMLAAEELFVEKGFYNVAVSDIVKKLGVAQGTFYYYFQSKDDLLNQILDNSLNSLEQKVAITAADPDLSVLEKLHITLRAMLFSGYGKQNMTAHIDNELNSEVHSRLEQKFFTKMYPQVAKIVSEGVAEKIFTTACPNEITQILLFGIQGYMHVNYPSFKDRDTVNKKIKGIEEILERALGLKEGSINLKI